MATLKYGSDDTVTYSVTRSGGKTTVKVTKATLYQYSPSNATGGAYDHLYIQTGKPTLKKAVPGGTVAGSATLMAKPGAIVKATSATAHAAAAKSVYLVIYRVNGSSNYHTAVAYAEIAVPKLPSVSGVSFTRRYGRLDDVDAMGDGCLVTASWSCDPSLSGSAADVTVAFGSYTVGDNVKLSGASGSVDVFVSGGTMLVENDVSATVKVTDSAGGSASGTAADATAYTKPVVTSVLCVRVGEDGELADDGTRMKCVVGWRVAAVGSQRKPFALDVVASHGGSRVESASAGEFSPTVSGGYATGVTTLELDGPFDTDERYDVKIELMDRVNLVRVTDTLTKAYFPFDLLRGGGHGLAVGKPATQADLLDVGYDLNVDGDASLNGLSLHGKATLPTYEIAAAWSGNQAAFAALLPHRPCIALSADGYELWFDGDPTTD